MNEPEPKPDDAPPAKPKPLSAHEAAEFAGRVAELSSACLPLAPGLRAAAAELPKGRLAATMLRVAAALERGDSLDRALAAENGVLPRYLETLVAAGTRTGKLGRVLEEFVHFRQSIGDIRRSVWTSLAYPAFLVFMIAAVACFFFGLVVRSMAPMYRDFKQQLPPGLRATIAISDLLSHHFGGLLLGVAAAVLVIIALGFMLGLRRRRRLLNCIPLFGVLGRFSGLAEMACLVRILLTNEVPLPEALRLAADGIGDADLAAGCRQLAERVESGTLLAGAIDGLRQLSPTLRPIFAWGEGQSALPEAMDAVAQVATRRVRLRADLLKTIIPPTVVLLVAIFILMILNLFMPMVSLISSLTGGVTTLSGGISSTSSPPVSAWSLSPVTEVVLIYIAALITWWLVGVIKRSWKAALQFFVRVAEWLIVTICLFGVMVFAFGLGFGIVLWLGAMFWLGVAAFRFRRSQQLTLLNLMAISADRGMPLAPAVRALGEEEGGLFYSRAIALADCLAAGMPVPEAIEQNRKVLPPRSVLAARIGEKTGDLGAALRCVDDGRSSPVSSAERQPIRWASLVYILAGVGVVVPFMVIKIAPAMQKIFQDFHRHLPPLTRAVFNVASSEFTFALCALALAVAAAVVIYVVFRQLGWIRFDLPPIGRILAPLDAAAVLRWLALAAERGQPLEPTLGLLAVRYPRRLIRDRLRSAGADIFCGRDWADSLRAAKLVQSADAAILRAAARVGNLPWALTEAAASGERRLNYRMYAFSQIVFPFVILAAGGIVLLIVVGWFSPIIELVSGLAKPR
ncbi:MAG TPA: type II secretion system F family protein [Pirellulales bacterium]|nr:type II secretion system F family protein [Pirellulales bacterium]